VSSAPTVVLVVSVADWVVLEPVVSEDAGMLVVDDAVVDDDTAEDELVSVASLVALDCSVVSVASELPGCTESAPEATVSLADPQPATSKETARSEAKEVRMPLGRSLDAFWFPKA
jgi:hypothetical protein